MAKTGMMTGAKEQKQKYRRVFLEPQNGDVVNFKMERLHDTWIITSDELPGLFLNSNSMAEVIDQIRPAIEGLWEVIQHPEKYNVKA